jgi:hypothetical protein
MAIRALMVNGIDNTALDGMRAHRFLCGGLDCIVEGALNQGTFAYIGNAITLDTCELVVSGARFVVDDMISHVISDSPAVAVNYAMVFYIEVADGLITDYGTRVQLAETPLVKQNVFTAATACTRLR